jgi:threonine dehydrogenase-like Zn-dependent dehydrogenase
VCYPATSLLPIPDTLDDRTAALAEPFGVALRAVELAAPSPSDLAYVSGLGSIGLLTVCGLRATGCRVVGADPREDRRELGRAVGCQDVFDPTREDPFSKVAGHDPHGARAAFECSGVPESLQQVIDACGPNGTVGILGIPMGMVNLLRMTVREQRAFSIAGPSIPSMRRALDLLEEGSPAARIVSGTVPLEETGAAMERLSAGNGGVKVLVEPGR